MVLVKDKENQRLGVQLATNRQEYQELQKKFKDNNKALDKLADDNIKLGAKKDGLENTIEELHKAIDESNSVLDKKNKELLAAKESLKAANEGIEKAGQELREKQQTIDNYLDVINTRNKEIKELNSKKDSLESLNYEYQKELDDAATRYVALEQVKNKYRILAITGFIVVIIISILGIFA